VIVAVGVALSAAAIDTVDVLVAVAGCKVGADSVPVGAEVTVPSTVPVGSTVSVSGVPVTRVAVGDGIPLSIVDVAVAAPGNIGVT
jgi:hypothetical protein